VEKSVEIPGSGFEEEFNDRTKLKGAENRPV
jgi:hypothetical protein